ncbi:carboxypeptidase B [Sodiomyces alkalinus F11]|uniref:Carboxypeptidase B n=1 Tax=Sodiomyces alkalinus (strain CBS 110278 / VKM F-3762 / F11) TaxID=1314773 RepID=A0A3N2PNR9_SODAK|nr:carboxypeptidase B [Sodiomyces alkalinus F11]ROT36080.1 carboxypeptidase B [Sodiomyces alkalinus F11]
MKLLVGLGAVAVPLVSARIVAPRGPSVSYDGYRVYRVDTHADVATVESQIRNLRLVNFSPGTIDHLDLAVSPEDISAFDALGLDAAVVHEDLGKDILSEGPLRPYLRTTESADLPGLEWFDNYHPYEDHLQFLEDLHLAFPDNSELVTAGASYEGRPIQGIHFWGENGKGGRPAVYWHGTVHAREWITTMTVEYLLYQLISGYLDGTEDVKAIVDAYDFYILPVVNPDGFIHTQTTDRMWRKNRQPRDAERCTGTDVNRNWPHFWNVTGGASDSPCAETFRGLSPGDTPEMQSLVAFTDAVAAANEGGIKLYIDWHSYGHLILLSYGGDCDARVENYERQMELARGTAAVVETVDGSKYTAGPVCDVLYAASGGSMDYVYDVAGAELSWGYELSPADAAGGGFVLPADQILPTVVENWEGMRWLLSTM